MSDRTIDETLEAASQVLIRCAVMGAIVLLFWWAALAFFGDLAYRAHSALAPMTREQFTIVHYAAILATKAAVSILFFIPFVAIRLVIRRRTRNASI